MCKGETFRLHLDAALSGSSWMPLSRALPTRAAALTRSVELRAGPFVYKPLCVGAGMLTSEPRALDMTGLEPKNPFALALELSSLGLHAGTMGGYGWTKHQSVLGTQNVIKQIRKR